jgi:hypothetical protein
MSVCMQGRGITNTARTSLVLSVTSTLSDTFMSFWMEAPGRLSIT